MHGFGQATSGQGAPGFGAQSMGIMGHICGMGGTSGVGGMAMQHFGPQTLGSLLGHGQQPVSSQGIHGFGAQTMSNMSVMPLGGWNGNMPFHSMVLGAKPGKQYAQAGKRPASGSGPPGHLTGKRRFSTQCNSYGLIPIPMKMEVMQLILPEVWNPVTAASKTCVDLDSAMAIGFDRWAGSPLETRMATGLD